jgi:hypothetical protein
VSGNILVIRDGLRWCDAPAAYGLHETIYNRFIRWGRLGGFNRIFAALIDALPRAKTLLGDKGYGADWLRTALAQRGIAACIPSKANRKVPFPHCRCSQ